MLSVFLLSVFLLSVFLLSVFLLSVFVSFLSVCFKSVVDFCELTIVDFVNTEISLLFEVTFSTFPSPFITDFEAFDFIFDTFEFCCTSITVSLAFSDIVTLLTVPFFKTIFDVFDTVILLQSPDKTAFDCNVTSLIAHFVAKILAVPEGNATFIPFVALIFVIVTFSKPPRSNILPVTSTLSNVTLSAPSAKIKSPSIFILFNFEFVPLIMRFPFTLFDNVSP